eukprot:1158566-Pleurochrysis_carterae.AAC.1
MTANSAPDYTMHTCTRTHNKRTNLPSRARETGNPCTPSPLVKMPVCNRHYAKAAKPCSGSGGRSKLPACRGDRCRDCGRGVE